MERSRADAIVLSAVVVVPRFTSPRALCAGANLHYLACLFSCLPVNCRYLNISWYFLCVSKPSLGLVTFPNSLVQHWQLRNRDLATRVHKCSLHSFRRRHQNLGGVCGCRSAHIIFVETLYHISAFVMSTYRVKALRAWPRLPYHILAKDDWQCLFTLQGHSHPHSSVLTLNSFGCKPTCLFIRIHYRLIE